MDLDSVISLPLKVPIEASPAHVGLRHSKVSERGVFLICDALELLFILDFVTSFPMPDEVELACFGLLPLTAS